MNTEILNLVPEDYEHRMFIAEVLTSIYDNNGTIEEFKEFVDECELVPNLILDLEETLSNGITMDEVRTAIANELSDEIGIVDLGTDENA